MTQPDDDAAPARQYLTRRRVLRAAVALADAKGIEALSMRRLAKELGGGAMSLYNHVAHKEDLLSGMIDLVFTEVEAPLDGDDWQTAMRRRAASVRRVLTRHRWAVGLLDSSTLPGPATLRHHDAVLGCLRGAGFSVALAAHAYAALDSYVYGFALQERGLPFDTPQGAAEVARLMLEQFPPDQYPHLHEMAAQHVLQPGYDFGAEFGFGLELVIEGLARALQAEVPDVPSH